MRAGVALLADDGDDAVVVAAVTVAVEVLDRLDLARVGRDFDLVALTAVEVADHVVAESVNPMVVGGIVLAGDADPVDRAVAIDVLCDDLVLGVDLQFEAEGVRAATAGERIVDRFERRVSSAKICVVPSWAATISPASERLSRSSLPVPPSIRSAPKPPTSTSAPLPPDRLSLPEPPQSLSAPVPPLSVSFPAMPETSSSPEPPKRLLLVVDPFRWSWPEVPPPILAKKSSKRPLSKSPFRLKRAIYSNLLFRGLTKRKTTTSDFGNREVMRAGRT